MIENWAKSSQKELQQKEWQSSDQHLMRQSNTEQHKSSVWTSSCDCSAGSMRTTGAILPNLLLYPCYQYCLSLFHLILFQGCKEGLWSLDFIFRWQLSTSLAWRPASTLLSSAGRVKCCKIPLWEIINAGVLYQIIANSVHAGVNIWWWQLASNVTCKCFLYQADEKCRFRLRLWGVSNYKQHGERLHTVSVHMLYNRALSLESLWSRSGSLCGKRTAEWWLFGHQTTHVCPSPISEQLNDWCRWFNSFLIDLGLCVNLWPSRS